MKENYFFLWNKKNFVFKKITKKQENGFFNINFQITMKIPFMTIKKINSHLKN